MLFKKKDSLLSRLRRGTQWRKSYLYFKSFFCRRLYQILRCCFATMVIFTYPLQLLVSVEIIKEYVSSEKTGSGLSPKTDEIALRAILVVTTCKFY